MCDRLRFAFLPAHRAAVALGLILGATAPKLAHADDAAERPSETPAAASTSAPPAAPAPASATPPPPLRPGPDFMGYAPCENMPTESDIAAAKGAFQAGTAAYTEGDYSRAITYWEDAFRRDCTATPMLLNLSRAYEFNLQFDRAIVALQTFVDRNPDTPDRDAIQRRIERLEEQFEEQKKAQAAHTPPPKPEKAEPEPPPSEPQTEPAAPETRGKNTTVPLIVMISGGAVALVGGGIYLKAWSDIKGFEDKCPNHQCVNPADKTASDEARDRAVAGGWIFGAGAAAGVAGAIWFYLESKREQQSGDFVLPSRRIRLEPQLGPGFAGIRLGGAL